MFQTIECAIMCWNWYNLSANLTNTGITDAWKFNWTTNRSGQTVFANGDTTSKDVTVETTAGNRQYGFTFTATPPAGANDDTVIKRLSFRSPDPQGATIKSPTLVSGTTYKLTANTTDKGLNFNSLLTHGL